MNHINHFLLCFGYTHSDTHTHTCIEAMLLLLLVDIHAPEQITIFIMRISMHICAAAAAHYSLHMPQTHVSSM